MWRPSVQFYPIVLSRPLPHVPLSTRLTFLLGILAGRETCASVFMSDSLISLPGMRSSCEAVLVLQLPLYFLFA